MEEILPHRDQEIYLLWLDDTLLFDPEAFAKLGIRFSFWRIRNRTNDIQSVARKLIPLTLNDNGNLVDLGFNLKF